MVADEYGIPADEAIPDVDWLALAGREGWAGLIRDDRIRYRPAERAAVTDTAPARPATSGNLRARDVAALYLAVLDQLAAACGAPGPFLFTVSRNGLRRIDLDN